LSEKKKIAVDEVPAFVTGPFQGEAEILELRRLIPLPFNNFYIHCADAHHI